jgi:hypothetical protein
MHSTSANGAGRPAAPPDVQPVLPDDAPPALADIVRQVAGLIRAGQPLRFLLMVGGLRVSLKGGPAALPAHRPAAKEDWREQLTSMERRIIDTLGAERLTGEEIAGRLGLGYTPSLRSLLASMRKREILSGQKGEPGYRVTDAGRAAVEEQRPWQESRSRPARQPARFSPLEERILEAVGTEKLTGEEIAEKLGLGFATHVRNALAALRRQKILDGAPGEPGYSLTYGGKVALEEIRKRA